MPTDAGLTRWQRFCLISGLLWAFAVVTPDLYRVIWPLGTLGFTADNDGLVVDVAEDGPAASVNLLGLSRPLQVGDSIELEPALCRHLFGSACRDAMAVFGGMSGLTYVRPGITISLPIAPEYDQNVDTAWLTITSTRATLDWPARMVLLLDEAAGFLVIWESFRLVWRRPCRMTLGFFLYAMWFNPGQYFALYAWLQPHPLATLIQEVLQSCAQGAGYAGFLVFALRFPHDATEPRLQWLEQAAPLLGIALIALQLLSFLNVFGWHTEIVTRCAILGGYVIDASVLTVVAYRRRGLAPQDYQRMRWILWGCIIGLPAFIIADSNEATTLWTRYVWSLDMMQGWSPPEWLLELGYLISGLLAYGVCVAVRRPRVIAISYHLRRLAAGAVILLLAGIVEELGKFPIEHFVESMELPYFLAVIARILSAGLGVWIGERVCHVADHYWNRRFYHSEHHLAEIGERAHEAVSEIELDAVLVKQPTETLGLASAALFRKKADIFYRRDGAIGWDNRSRTELRPSEIPALIEKLTAGKSARTRLGDWHLTEVGTDLTAPTLAIPIRGDALYAIALYGPHASGDDIDPNEETLLHRLAEDAAAGYDHAELRRLRALEQSLQNGLDNPAP